MAAYLLLPYRRPEREPVGFDCDTVVGVVILHYGEHLKAGAKGGPSQTKVLHFGEYLLDDRYMQLIGLDISEAFHAQNQHMPWAWEVDALVMELANRKWAGPAELVHDYPTAEAKPPSVVFSIAGGRVLVHCLVLFRQGIILIKEFILSKAQTLNKKQDAVGGKA